MQIEELFDLTTWIDTEIVKPGIISLYQNLQSVLNHNVQPSTSKLAFEDQKEALFNGLLSVPLSDLSVGQLEILNSIDIGANVGRAGVETLEDVLFKNALDIATAANKITESIAELNKGVQWASQTRTLLVEIINEDAVREASQGVLMRVHFQKGAHLSNLAEFKDWGKVWYDIGRGIAMSNGAAPEDIQVVGASKGSIIITLMAAYGIAKTTSAILLEGLKVAEKVFEIRKTALEIKALKLSNNEAEKLLEAEAKTAKESGINTIVDNAVKQIGLDPKIDGDKVKALDNSVKNLISFIEKGGEVDFVVPDEAAVAEGDAVNPDTATRNELRAIFKEVRTLEKKLQLLEFKDDK